ncbi:site-2 protease family protein [Candidatus Falkowbacteria bacterium]|nr:site-2 protease family protein [Candidatus Falkowbacteria bacterium]
MLLQLLFEQPLIFIPLFLALLFALSFHELSHGLVAYWLGDMTAKDAGRLTFNPIKHIDPMGVILLLIIGFGWGKPVPVNHYNLKFPKWGPALVGVAGPISNLLFALVAGYTFMAFAPSGLNPVDLYAVLGSASNLMLIFLSFLVVYNIMLMVFNLLPIPPLDGSSILFAILPPQYDKVVWWLQTRGPMVLFGFIIADSLFNLGIFAHSFSSVLNLFSKLF